MKTLAQVIEALNKKVNSDEIKKLSGFNYLPWNTSTKLANDIFGFLGWSSTVVSCDQEIYNSVDKNGEATRFVGYKSIIRVTVRVRDEGGGTLESHHDGVGFGEVGYQGNKNPMDTAVKGAASDGISRALKYFGDALGLFLYDKEDPTNNTVTSSQTSNTSSSSNSNGNSSSGQKYPVSAGRVSHIISNFKLTQEQVNAMDNKTAGLMLDKLWKEKIDKQVILQEFGYAPSTAKKLVPAGGVPDDEDMPF